MRIANASLKSEAAYMGSSKGVIHSSQWTDPWLVNFANLQLDTFNLTSDYELYLHPNDWQLLEKLKDLVSDGRDLLALTWAPSMFSASIGLEFINFNYNPTGRAGDPCVASGHCAFPPKVIISAYAHYVEDHFQADLAVALDEFFHRFDLERSHLEWILRNYTHGKDLRTSVCTWIRENQDTWSPWLEDYGIYDYSLITFDEGLIYATYAFSGLLLLVCLAGLKY